MNVMRSRLNRWLLLLGSVCLGVHVAWGTTKDAEGGAPVPSVQVYDTDYPFIGYADRPVHNDIARLQQRLDRGELTLTYAPAHGYLESLLQALNIDRSSQVLVFSKTSLQVESISPKTPRALYFGDDTYVGWIPDAKLIEIVTMDADRGPVFYTLPNTDGTGAHIQRETLRCLSCHDSFSELGGGVPSFKFESVYDVEGKDLLQDTVARETTDATPIAQRWGGWYVTGDDHGTLHLGNILPPSARMPFARAYRGSLTSLAGLVDTGLYVSDKSDIVALLVMEHQVFVHNLIIHANYKSRAMLAREVPDALTPAGASLHWNELPPPTRTRLAAMLEPLVRGLFMIDMAPLPHPLTGDSGFTAQFPSRGPRDARGRSLRDLDLTGRVFRYPLSFLIYSDTFQGLPLCIQEHLYQRLSDILTGQDHSPAYATLSAADREAVLEILHDTHAQFRSVTSAPAVGG